MFDVGYFGDHGTHLLGAEEINQPMPGAWIGVVTSSYHKCDTHCDDMQLSRHLRRLCPALEGFQQCLAVAAFTSSTCDRVLNQIKP